LYHVLHKHPEVFLTPVKETNFFDLNYEKGVNWYESFFSDSKGNKVVGEVGHRYFRQEGVAGKIKDTLEKPKLIVGLREPCSYFVSDYLYSKKNGMFHGDTTDYASEKFSWDVLEYKKYFSVYADTFPLEDIFIYDFNELKTNPKKLYLNLCSFLKIENCHWDVSFAEPVNKASSSRNPKMARALKILSIYLKRLGGQKVIAYGKKNSLLKRLLYKELKEQPVLSSMIKAELIDKSRPNVEWMDKTFSLNLIESWGYKR